MLHNTHIDRARIRNELGIQACMIFREFTPVLILYWTQKNLQQFLVPCSKVELAKLRYLHGVDENGPDSESCRATFEWLREKIRHNDLVDGDGEWYEKYYVDVKDEHDRPLPPISCPPNTVVIVTGYIP